MLWAEAGISAEHTVLGKGKLKKLARELDGKVLFEFRRFEKECRRGAGRRKMMWCTYNRWVAPESLKQVEELAVEDAESMVDFSDGDNDQVDARCQSPAHHKKLNKRARINEDVARAAAHSSTPSSAVQVEEEEIAEVLGQRPKLAAHEHARKLKKKAEAAPQCRLGRSGQRKTPESRVTPEARCKEFNEPNDQSLFVSTGRIKCAACAEVRHNKWSSLLTHVNSSKHKGNLAKWQRRKADDAIKKQDIAAYYAENIDEQMSSVDGDEMLFRYRVSESFLRNGLPLSKVDGMRTLLQRSGYSLTNSSHLRAFIPKIEKDEVSLLAKELHGQSISTAFDGTTRLGEAVNMVNRWCTAGFISL